MWAEHEDVLRFWFDRGAAGVRIDSAALLVKDPELSEEPPESRSGRASVHRSGRAARHLPALARDRRQLPASRACSSARSGCRTPSGFARYLRPDELHTAFNFDFLACPWEPGPMRASIDSALAAHAPVDAPATWVLSNHDVTRPVTRYGRADTSFAFESKREGTPTDLARGTRRARAAALLAMALPGSMYVYQGEELGLPEVEDIPSDRRQDPMWLRSGGRRPGPRRLPRAAALGGRHAALRLQQRREPTVLARPARRLGAAHRRGAERRPGLDAQPLPRRPAPAPRVRRGATTRRLRWLPSADEVARVRARRRASPASSTSARQPVELPAGADVLIASDELEGGALPQDTTVWLLQAGSQAPFAAGSTRTEHSIG